MNHLDISRCWSVVAISSIRRVGTWAISNIFFEISPLDQVSYLLLQLEAVFSVVPMVLVELAILVLISLSGVGLDLSKSLYEFLVFDLCEFLSYESIERSSVGLRLLSFVIFSSSPFALGFGQLFYSNVFVGFALECRLGFRNTFGKRVEKRIRVKSFHHCHDYYLVTGAFYL
ncbi:hypothetical protein Acr_00g0029450 [Actinidia rufa]|uniref:Uncharacterized protein n=1 Tax=Actinidia rufa TaxID=165716 RepID=A0A7J0DGG6_9ERIC|nr:hypothetical protein Acr_00g0029450 [Actinidia rufa]